METKDTKQEVNINVPAKPAKQEAKPVETPKVKAKPKPAPKVKAKPKAKPDAPVKGKIKTKGATKPKAKSKKTVGSSLTKLGNWADKAVSTARTTNPEIIAKTEKAAVAGVIAVRKLVGKQSGKLSVFGNAMHGMSARLDEALFSLKIDPTDFGKIVKHIASGPNTARRSKPTEHGKLVTHMLNHLKRCSANGIHSASKFKKPLAKVGLEKKVDEISNHMKPTLLLFQMYNVAGQPKKVVKKTASKSKAKSATK